MSASTREGLWLRLREAALVEGEPAPDEGRSPWFVRVMLGVAGWIGALFLLGFVGVAFAFVMKSAAASFMVGALVCAAAALLFRAGGRGDLLGQFGLAVSLAGQALMAIGLVQWFGKPAGTGFALAVQQAVLFALIPNFVHRIWTAWSGAYAAVFALGAIGLAAYAPALLTAGFVLVWLREFEHPRHGELLRAGGYGLAIACVQTAVMHGPLTHGLIWGLAHDAQRPLHAWAGAFACSAVLLWAAVALLRRERVALASGPGRIGLAGAAILALVSLKAPGVAPATAILVIGYANGNRLLAGLGVAALIGYLSHYYYSLQATLLEKSALLAGAGLALLLARLALQRWWPRKEAGDA